MFPQGVQSLFDLVERVAEGAEASAGLEGGTNLFDIVVWILPVEEERVGLSFVETLLDVAQFEINARSESHAPHIFPREILHIRTGFKCKDKMLMTQTDELREVAVTRKGGIIHEVILLPLCLALIQAQIDWQCELCGSQQLRPPSYRWQEPQCHKLQLGGPAAIRVFLHILRVT